MGDINPESKLTVVAADSVELSFVEGRPLLLGSNGPDTDLDLDRELILTSVSSRY